MPHKGTRSTVSVPGVGLMPPWSGGNSGEDAWHGRGTRLSASAQSQPARTELEGVRSKPELPDEFLPTQDELTFMALWGKTPPTQFLYFTRNYLREGMVTKVQCTGLSIYTKYNSYRDSLCLDSSELFAETLTRYSSSIRRYERKVKVHEGDKCAHVIEEQDNQWHVWKLIKQEWPEFGDSRTVEKRGKKLLHLPQWFSRRHSRVACVP